MYEDFFGERPASSKSSKRPRRSTDDDDDEMEDDGASDDGAVDDGGDDEGSEQEGALDDDEDDLGFDDLLNAAPRRAADLLGDDDDDEAAGSSGSEAVGASAFAVSAVGARMPWRMGLMAPRTSLPTALWSVCRVAARRAPAPDPGEHPEARRGESEAQVVEVDGRGALHAVGSERLGTGGGAHPWPAVSTECEDRGT